MGDRVNKEEVERANDVHIVDYLNSKGEPINKEGKYYRHEEHNSLVINENGKWFWNSRNTGGYGSISFAREFYDVSFQDAVRDVNNQGISKDQTIDRTRQQERKEEFSYPSQYESDTQKSIKEYLTNERAISSQTVDNLISSGLVAEDKLNNCVFKWKDNSGKIVGADRQGTTEMDNGKYFKQVVANSKEDGGFQFDVGNPDKIALFESPIDAISYYDLNKPTDIRLKSMSGLKDRSAATSLKDLVKENNEKGIGVNKVILAVDNDYAGNEFAKKWESMIGISERHLPKGKDWNMDLQNKRERELKRINTNHIVMEMER